MFFAERLSEMSSATPGATVWLTGLPAAGKSTIARAVAALLPDDVEILDGDELRATLSSDLGFSPAARVCRLLAGRALFQAVPVRPFQ